MMSEMGLSGPLCSYVSTQDIRAKVIRLMHEYYYGGDAAYSHMPVAEWDRLTESMVVDLTDIIRRMVSYRMHQAYDGHVCTDACDTASEQHAE